jgi:hypothetical protein
MAKIMSDSNHVILHSVDKKTKKAEQMFPTNTTDDVIINDDGDVITEFVMKITDSGKDYPVGVTQLGEVTIEDACLNVINGTASETT